MTQQLPDMIAAARPGTRIRIIEIEVPEEPDSVTLFSVSEGNNQDEYVPSAPYPESGQALSTNELRLRQLLELAAGPLKPAEWARLIARVWRSRVSERELDRAITAKAIDGRVKGEGKDHRAIVVEPDEMARYLTLCDAVQQGSEPRPPWWTDVRRGMNASIREAA